MWRENCLKNKQTNKQRNKPPKSKKQLIMNVSRKKYQHDKLTFTMKT